MSWDGAGVCSFVLDVPGSSDDWVFFSFLFSSFLFLAIRLFLASISLRMSKIALCILLRVCK